MMTVFGQSHQGVHAALLVINTNWLCISIK
jgi:hypothetical protein